MNGYQRLSETFAEAERCHPDLMERYSSRLAEAATADERVEIMRAGLRETICARYPLPEARQVVAVVPDTQGAQAL